MKCSEVLALHALPGLKYTVKIRKCNPTNLDSTSTSSWIDHPKNNRALWYDADNLLSLSPQRIKNSKLGSLSHSHTPHNRLQHKCPLIINAMSRQFDLINQLRLNVPFSALIETWSWWSIISLTFCPFPEDALDLGRGGGLRAVEELPVSLLLGRVELGEGTEIGKIILVLCLLSMIIFLPALGRGRWRHRWGGCWGSAFGRR